MVSAMSSLTAFFSPDETAVKNRRLVLAVGLCLSTLATTTLAGAFHMQAFREAAGLAPGSWWLGGLPFSIGVVMILGGHELAHWFFARRSGVNVSPPMFVPVPIATGTIGAFIRLRGPIPSRTVSFDISASGPVVGFVLATVVLFVGAFLSVAVLPWDSALSGGQELGAPLWLAWALALVGPTVAVSEVVALHPLALAGWIGLLLTALNLIPIGQMDGGRIVHALGGPGLVSATGYVAVFGTALAAGFSLVPIAWAVVFTVMGAAGGLVPPGIGEGAPRFGGRRISIAALCVVIFAVSFTSRPLGDIYGDEGDAGPVRVYAVAR